MNNNNDYEIIKELSSGAFGHVYKGRIKSTGEEVAIKRVPKSIINKDIYYKQAFFNELNIMKKINSPNSVRFITYFISSTNYNIILELCDGDMAGLLANKKRYSAPEIREIFLQLCNVFRIMSKENIIHRDLKLNNILFKYKNDPNNHNCVDIIPKLGDYGLSKILDGRGITDTHCGTPLTMAPEVLMDREYNYKADLWSIGVLMYQLYFGTYPFIGTNNKQAFLNKLLHNPKRSHPEESDLDDLINSCLVVDVDKRITWDEYLNHKFFVGQLTHELINLKVNDPYDHLVDIYNSKETINVFLEKRLSNKKKLESTLSSEHFSFYTAFEEKIKRVVFVKESDAEFFQKHKKEYEDEISKIMFFRDNKNVLQFLYDIEIEDKKKLAVFSLKEDDKEGEYMCLDTYMKDKNNSFTETELSKFVRTFSEEVFSFIEKEKIVFSILTLSSFIINVKTKRIFLSDLGFQKQFLSEKNVENYFISSNKKEIISEPSIKSNVLNFGVVVLNMFFNDISDLKIKPKSITFPCDGKIMSKVFINFISKCLYRDKRKRYSWSNFASDEFLGVSNINNGHKYTLFNDFRLNSMIKNAMDKYRFICNYYKNFEFNENTKFIKEIEIFLILNFYEIKFLINLIMKKTNKKLKFSELEEISFVTIVPESQKGYELFSLNLGHPVISQFNVLDLNGVNDLSKQLEELKKICVEIVRLSKKINAFTNSNYTSKSFKDLIFDCFEMFYKGKMINFMYEILNNAINCDKVDKGMYIKNIGLSEYICETLIFIRALTINDNNFGNLTIYERGEFHLTKEYVMLKLDEIFNNKISGGSSEINKIEVTLIKIKKTYPKYIIFSFSAGMMRKIKKSLENEGKNINIERSKINQFDSFFRLYPEITKLISEINSIN